jgi:eukaryotic-like serine/threonine-protein kinase
VPAVGAFLGGKRFEVERRLGSGGMGEVYQVYDHELRAKVALKTLRAKGPGSLYRFKHEFRALCDVAHPNLVSLYELLVVDGRWMFTMELVEGSDILVYLRREPSADRCRGAFRQLAEAVSCLHDSGQLHRDIKPSNILVTEAGRVVVLDFGLVTALDAQTPVPTDYVLATPGYVAPEVLTFDPPGTAADWYSVGAVLYEVLTGEAPKRPPAGVIRVPRDVAPDADPALSDLAFALLERDPERRPRGDDVLERLGAAPRARTGLAAPPLDRRRFVGRDAELARLEAALRDGTRAAFVSGPSGIGKTTLVEQFAQRARGAGAIVVQARSYERESVPLKMLDALIDSLTEQLLALDKDQLAEVLPRDILSLARLFPVLRRVAPGSEAAGDRARDPQEQRRRGLAALRELLATLGARQPVLIVVDDFQWSDVESAILLDDILGPPDPPRGLLVLCYRSDAAKPSDAIDNVLRSSLGKAGLELALDALASADAHDLARAWLDDQHAAVVVREAQGIPFFVQELVRHMRTVGAAPVEKISLDEVLQARIARLPDEARRVLEVAAVAGYPIPQALALDAAGVAQGPSALAVLRAEHMIRTGGTRADDVLVTYHDRIRWAVLSGLPGDGARPIHRQIARVLERRADADPDTLTFHLRSGDEPAAAAAQASKAADRAAEQLAFDRAAHYYRLALELAPRERTDELALRRKLAEALANAGRGEASADEYLRTADGLAGDERGRLQQRAAEQLLRCGHAERGLTTIAELFRDLGVWFPRRRFTTLLALAYHRFRLWLRGYRIRATRPDDRLARLADVYQSVCLAMALSDPMPGIDMHTRALRISLRIGDLSRVCRGFAYEAVVLGAARANSDAHPTVRRLLADSHRLRGELGTPDDPMLLGHALGSESGIAYFNGKFARSFELAERAIATIQDCADVWWELAQMQVLGLSALYWLGDIAEVCRRTFAYLQDAKSKGDRFKASCLRGALTNVAWLALDMPDEARRHADEAKAEWREQFDLQHSYNVYAQAQIDLYTGDAAAALHRIASTWGKTRRALMLTVPVNRINLVHARGRAALMAGRLGPARRDARRLHREGIT